MEPLRKRLGRKVELKDEGSGDESDANECERIDACIGFCNLRCWRASGNYYSRPAHSRAAGLGRFAGFAAAIVCEWQRALVGTSLSRSALDSAAYGLVTLILALVLALSLSAPT